MFRRVLCGLWLLTAVGLLAGQDKKDVPKDLQPFQGTWKVVKAEADGPPPPADEIDKVRFIFAGEKITVEVDGKAEDEGTVKADPKKDPAEIDLTKATGDKKTARGIYKFEKDGKLVLSFTMRADETRPKAFTAKPGSKQIVMTLERVKAKK
jgi:uncharacterized protein (TIGR03067 family)